MYRKTVLQNGVRIVSEAVPHLKSVSLGLWVDAGSRDESEAENGISHFIEHMIFRGTDNRTGLEIAKELDVIGGLSNAFTGKENTCFHARVLDKHLPLLVDILADIFLKSKFDQTDMERERQVILQEIAMVEDSPEEKIHVLFNQDFWSKHPLGRSVLGTEENVLGIGKNDINNYMNKFYIPEKILVVAAGKIDHKDLVSRFETSFSSIDKCGTDAERKPPVSGGGLSSHFKDLEQVHVCLGGEAPFLSSEKRFSAAVLNTILGGNMSSRLFQEIRENRGLAYSVYSFISSYIDTGMLGIYAGCDPDNLNQLLETVKKEVNKICHGGLNPSDLESAKEHLTGSIYLGSENADNRMMRNAKNEFVFNRYVGYEELVSDINKVSVEEVAELAREIFWSKSLSFVSLGPAREEIIDKSNLEYAD